MGYVLEEGPQKASVDHITLDVEGTVMSEKQKGTIEMALVGGGWRQVKQSWK